MFVFELHPLAATWCSKIFTNTQFVCSVFFSRKSKCGMFFGMFFNFLVFIVFIFLFAFELYIENTKTWIDFHINPSHVLLFLIENKQNLVTDMQFFFRDFLYSCCYFKGLLKKGLGYNSKTNDKSKKWILLQDTMKLCPIFDQTNFYVIKLK